MRPRHVRSGKGEEGGLLIIVMIGAAVASIGLAVATQSWSSVSRRDKEEELIFRGNQYVDAILAYRKEHAGQFPINLENLYEPGPRGYRYIRKLYREPISKHGKWGLLYLMPGGRGVYDPKAAQAAQAGRSGQSAFTGQPAGGNIPGVTPINPGGTQLNPGGTGLNPGGMPTNPGLQGGGLPGVGGMVPGAPPQGSPLPFPEESFSSDSDSGIDDSISERPLGWPIVGVISRASAEESSRTFKIYKGHDSVDKWQFHVFERGIKLPEAPGSGAKPVTSRGVGPGYGGKPMIRGLMGGSGGARPRQGNRYPPQRGQRNRGGANRQRN
jgi:type II secretory pathway pseudopilin PulG